MNKLTSKLIAREFQQHRWMLAGTIAVGIASLGVAAGGSPILFNIGMLCWITAIAAFGCVLAMLGIATERKERSLLFVLSLPLSFSEYVRVKLFGLLLCYLVPWLALTAGAIALVLLRADMPDGLLPFTILICVFLLANFSFVLCSALAANSEGAMTLVIIVHNIAISLFIFLVGVIPGFFDHLKDPAPTWGTAFWTVLGIEAATIVIICSLPYFVVARRRDVI